MCTSVLHNYKTEVPAAGAGVDLSVPLQDLCRGSVHLLLPEEATVPKEAAVSEEASTAFIGHRGAF